MRKVLVAMLLLAASCASESERPPVAEEGAPRPEGVTSAASCVENYSLDTLESRDFAFDGTVRSVDPGEEDPPMRVTFTVQEWFKGGSGDEAVVRSHTFGAITSVGDEPRKIGDRLLVAGDDDFLWECGFTQAYDADVAAEWRSAL